MPTDIPLAPNHAPDRPSRAPLRPQYRRGTVRTRPSRSAPPSTRLALGLGWFSIALGAAGLVAPRRMSSAMGVPQVPLAMQALGMREIASGLCILGRRRKSPGLWLRLAGDVMDLALLAVAARSRNAQPARLAAAAASVAGVAALDACTALRQRSRERGGKYGPVRVEEAVTINRTAEECYRYWRGFVNLPQFMRHLESVETLDSRRSRWVAKGPAGTRVAWESEILADEPGRLIAWHTLPGAGVPHAGTVRFERAPGGRGTVVHVEMEYGPPGGELGVLFAKLFGEEPAQQVREDLRRFKQLMETGEIATTAGQPSGRRGAFTRFAVRKGVPG